MFSVTFATCYNVSSAVEQLNFESIQTTLDICLWHFVTKFLETNLIFLTQLWDTLYIYGVYQSTVQQDTVY